MIQVFRSLAQVHSCDGASATGHVCLMFASAVAVLEYDSKASSAHVS